MRSSLFIRSAIATAALVTLAAFALVPQAVAGTIQVDLNNLAFSNGQGSEVLNGSFTVDSTTFQVGSANVNGTGLSDTVLTSPLAFIAQGTVQAATNTLGFIFGDGYNDLLQFDLPQALTPGSFGSSNSVIYAPGEVFQYFGLDGGSASSGSLSIAAPTGTSAPEPTSLVLLLAGLGMVFASAAVRRRDRLPARG